MAKTTTDKQVNKPETNKESKGLSAAAWTTIGTIGVAAFSCISVIIVAALNPDLVNVVIDKIINTTPTTSPGIELTGTAIPSSTQPNTRPIDTQDLIQSTPQFSAIEDWKSNCISTTNWQPYLANQVAIKTEPCYNLVNWGIVAESGKLHISKTEIHNITALEFGILTDIRGKNKFEFSVHVTDLSSSEVWLGFFEGSTPQSKGIVVVIQPDDNIDIRSTPVGNELVDNVHLPLAEGDYNNIEVVFRSATITVVIDGQAIIGKRPIDIAPTKLFLGYRALPNAEIKATIRKVKFE